jgi:hypothetical protein
MGITSAFGSDREANEDRGYAKGIIAIGDTATGVLARGFLRQDQFVTEYLHLATFLAVR